MATLNFDMKICVGFLTKNFTIVKLVCYLLYGIHRIVSKFL